MDMKEFLPVWDKLSDTHKYKLKSSISTREFARGDIIHNDSNDCTGLMIVKSGRLRAYSMSEDGKEITLYRLFEYDICLFSASCMMNSIGFDIILSAEEKSEILLIPTEVYKSIMDESAPLANYTNEIMASRFSDVMWLIEQILWKSFDKRLAEFLINESEIENNTVLKITHEQIGNHLGNPREVVTRMLKYFQSENLVKLSRGTIEIININKLNNIIIQ